MMVPGPKPACGPDSDRTADDSAMQRIAREVIDLQSRTGVVSDDVLAEVFAAASQQQDGVDLASVLFLHLHGGGR